MTQKKAKAADMSVGAANDETSLILDYLPSQAIDVSTNLHNKVSKTHAAKVLRELHRKKEIEAQVSGKHTVYHAVQEATDELTMEAIATMDEKIKQLEEQATTFKTKEKKARTELATLSTKPLLCELRRDVGQLEQGTQAVTSRLKKIQESDSIQVSPEERAKLGQEWRRWNKIASVRKRICRDLWSNCLEVVPDSVSREELWSLSFQCSRPRNSPSLLCEMKNRTPLPVPSEAPSAQNGHSRNPSSGIDMAARSPPNQSNTKHVPCKFFRQGACQAGPACPFLHSTDAAIDYAPCKYFTKGNCKFGAKCALAHILPDGRRVNRPSPGMGMGGGHLNLGGRVNPQAYVNQDSALTNSVLSQQRLGNHDPRYASQLPPQEEFGALQQQQPPPPPFDAIPTIDAGLASDVGSKYGSPADDTRFPMSPSHRHLTALDAQLPASFDSQGISHVARYGPVAASVPSKFGLDLASPPAQRMGGPSDVLRNLRDTAYGSDFRKTSSFMGSSPPGIPEDGVGPRFLHSARPVKSRMLSASVPRPTALDDWDDSNFPMEEDYLPINLHDDVLTPQEKLRRLSRTDHDLSSSHRDLSGLGMTSTSFSKVGSPLASSPSRFGALFAKQRQQKKDEDSHGTSFSHIGSPLRESSLNLGTSPSLGPIGSRQISGDVSPYVASPGRQSSTSMISQQLSSMSLHPAPTRHSPAVGSNGRLDRTISSPVSTSKIDEEQSDLVFSMEEEDSTKRNSTSWATNKAESNDGASTPTSNSGFQP
ncbi:hypothetical protein ALT_2187 [Aspergillus lentulus]|uniref:C3H1-type domain-containing protein n=2 Tax=Aspergillus lentulus TaxID=293939 RepID=A0AAN4T8F7_ASPLE|nr:hypothetical protein ALT_2187 [Aspergillus lentulus]